MSTSQFSLLTNKTYDELIDKYNINEMEGFIKNEDLRNGKPYKVQEGGEIKGGVYGDTILRS